MSPALIPPVFGASYGLIRSRAFAKLQFRSLHMDDRFFEAYYRDTCAISKGDMIAFLKASAGYAPEETLAGVTARIEVLAGARETRSILRSVERLRASILGCEARLLPGLYHGELSLNHPLRYVRRVKELIGAF